MSNERVFNYTFSSIYNLYLTKVTKKARTEEELITVICWLTGYSHAGLNKQIEAKVSLAEFFNQAPGLHPNASMITGLICGYRVEDIEDPMMQKIRYMDKLVDELAKGKKLEKILRA